MKHEKLIKKKKIFYDIEQRLLVIEFELVLFSHTSWLNPKFITVIWKRRNQSMHSTFETKLSPVYRKLTKNAH